MSEFVRRAVVLVVATLMIAPLLPASALVTGPVDHVVVGGGHLASPAFLLSPGASRGGFDEDPVVVNATAVSTSTSWGTERSIVRDSEDTIHVVYVDDGEIWYKNSKNDGQTWSSPVNVSNNTLTSEHPAIATNGGVVYIVWVDLFSGTNGRVSLRNTTDNGTTWTPSRDQAPDSLYSADPRPYDPAVAADNSNNVYVVWVRNEDNAEGRPEDVVYFRRSTDSGSTWSGAVTVSDTNYMSHRPTVEADGNNVLISWMGDTSQFDPMNDYEVWFRTSSNGGQSLSAWPTRLSQNNQDDINPTVSLKSNNVTVVWQTWDGNDWDLVYRNSTNLGTSWTPATNQAPATLNDGNDDATSPSITWLDSELYCFWVSDSLHASGDIFMSFSSTKSDWSRPVNLTNDGQGHRWPGTKADSGDGWLEWVWTNGTAPNCNVLYKGVYVAGRPTLRWTQEAGYFSDGVEPDMGTTGHKYVFRVTYSDDQDEGPGPGYPMIYIDKDMDGNLDPQTEGFLMKEANASDTVFTDGKIYTLTVKFSVAGLSKYAVVAEDASGLLAVGPATRETNGPTITSVNEPPMLDWTGEEGFGDDGVDPDNGTPLTEFVFRIRYTDPLDEAPSAGFPVLRLDMTEDGDFDDAEDQEIALEEVSTADISYFNGKLYQHKMNLTSGNYSYQFYVEDPAGLTNETEVRSGPKVQLEGERPVLSVTGETGYTIDGVDPDTGYDTTEFTFRVLFTDSDGDLPLEGHPIIGIDRNLNGVISEAEKVAMDEDDAADTDTTDGKIFTHSTVLGTLGTYKYSFEALDGRMAPATTISFSGPMVDKVNAAPELKWIGTPGYDTDGLEPELGFIDHTEFVYRVLYEDSEGQAPMAGFPKIWVDLNIDGKDNASEWFTMEEADTSDTIYEDGKLYIYTRTFDSLGLFNYRFKAKDTVGGLAIGAPTAMKNGPRIDPAPNFPPLLVWVGGDDYNGTGVNPGKGDLDTTYTYKVRYIDVDGDLPKAGWPKVHVDSNGDGDYNDTGDFIATMEEEDASDTNVKDGKDYTYSTFLSTLATTYKYKFTARDANGLNATASGTLHELIFKGPLVVINERPILRYLGTTGFDGDGVNPNEANIGTEFTFKVLYKDAENETPLDGKVYIWIDIDRSGTVDATDVRKELEEEDPAEIDYIEGKVYFTTYTFTEPGTYGYLFEAQDASGSFAGGPASSYVAGPVIIQPIPNKLPYLTFTGEMNYVYDGVHPFSGEKGTQFVFRVRYFDPDNDAPADGYPKLSIEGIGQDLVMTEASTTDVNHVDGKVYICAATIDDIGSYEYEFTVVNTMNQTASLGPMDGPVVVEVEKEVTDDGKDQLLEDWMWILVVIIVAVVCVLVAYLASRPRAVVPAARPRDDYEEEAYAGSYAQEEGSGFRGAAPVAAYYEEPVPEPEPEPVPEEAVSEKEVAPEPEPGPPEEVEEDEGPKVPVWSPGGAKVEEAAEDEEGEGEEAEPEEKEEPPKEEEKKEGDKKEDIKDDLDDILAKLQD